MPSGKHPFDEEIILVLVLVLIKDDLFIKRILTQKASVYPDFFLTSEFTS